MKRIVAPTLLALTALASSALAQSATEQQPRTGQPGQSGQQNQQLQRGQQGQAGNLDKHIAAWMLLGNQEQVALAQFAQEKCESEECKQFAQMMVEQHQQAVSKIEQAAPQVAAMNLQLRNANLNQTGGQQDPPQANQQAGGMDPSLMMARQITEECLALTKQALSEKQGAEFDKAYIHQQVMAHMSMLASLKGSEPFASQQLKPVIQQAIQTTKEHHTQAKQLATQMKDSQSSPRQARAPQQ